MSVRGWIRIVIVAVMAIVAIFFIRLHVAGGQDQGDVAAGQRLVEAWCLQCHSLDSTTRRQGTRAPDFTGIARRPATTALALRAFLQSEHETMPNFIIQPRDADHIIAYILSLRRQ